MHVNQNIFLDIGFIKILQFHYMSKKYANMFEHIGHMVRMSVSGYIG